MMYHSPSGTTHTAKKSTVPFSYGFRPGPITFKLYSLPRRQKIVDFTCTRQIAPPLSTATSYRPDSP
jgi:hypothetical protein